MTDTDAKVNRDTADRLQRQVDAVRAVIDEYRDDVTADQIHRALDEDPS